jgi:predicted ArsR family transcriptional regulator
MQKRETSHLEREIECVAALEEPMRRALYSYVAAQPGDVSRDQAARAVGVSRSLAAFHLDRLVAEGLLDAVYRRLTGRSGPGAGRPSKLYRRSSREVQITLPPRSYELAARLFARALETSAPPETVGALSEVAHEFGREVGAQGGEGTAPFDSIESALATCGYEPIETADGTIRLRNCPFHTLATAHRGLVCTMNLHLIEGMVDGIGGETLRAVLDPQPGMCCVAIRRTQHRL